MNKEPQIKIKFSLIGDEFSKEYVSNRLGVISDRFKTKDDWPDAIKNAKDLPDHLKPRTVWGVDIKKESSYAVSDQFQKIIKIFNGKELMINKLCKELKLTAVFEIVIEMESGNRPEMVLTKEIIKFISLINAEIGFDLYID